MSKKICIRFISNEKLQCNKTNLMLIIVRTGTETQLTAFMPVSNYNNNISSNNYIITY